MKKQLLLLALTLGTQVSAETLKDVLGAQGELYLKIIDSATLYPAQDFIRKKLIKALTKDLSTMKTEELVSIAASLEDFATNVIAPQLKQSRTSLSSEEFSQLVQQVRSQLNQLAAPQPTVATAGRTLTQPVSSVQQQVAPATVKSKKSVHFADSTLDQESDTDNFSDATLDQRIEANNLRRQANIDADAVVGEINPEWAWSQGIGIEHEVPKDVDLDDLEQNVNALMLDVIELNKMSKNRESDSDINADTVFEEYKDIFKQLIEDNEWSRNDEVSDEENCKELLQLYFDHLGLEATDYDAVLPTFTTALVALQNKMSGRLALPIHPSLQMTNNNPLLDIPSINDQIEASITRLEKLDPAEADKIKKLFAENQAKLQVYLGSLNQEEDEEKALLESLDSLVDQADEALSLLQNEETDAFLAQSTQAKEELQDLDADTVLAQASLALMRTALRRSKNPIEELSYYDAAQLLKMENDLKMLEQILNITGNNKDALRTALSDRLSDSQKDELAEYIFRLLNRPKSSSKDFARDLQILNHVSQDPTAMAKHGSIGTFVNRHQKPLRSLINTFQKKNKRPASSEELRSELLMVLDNKLHMSSDHYNQALPALTDALVALQKEIDDKKQEQTEKKKQRNKAFKKINGSADNFITYYQPTLEGLISQKWAQNGDQPLDENGRTQLLESFLTVLGLQLEEYQQMLPGLVDRLALLEDEMWLNRQSEFDPMEEFAENVERYRRDNNQALDLAQLPSEEVSELAKEQTRQYQNLVSKIQRELKRNRTDSANKIINLSRQKLEKLIQKQWNKNGNHRLNETQCRELLIDFLQNHIYLNSKDYNPMLPQLVTSLMSLQDEMSQNSQV